MSAPREKLQWEDERAVASDGVVYVLASEDLSGRHGGRMWEVFVYDRPHAPVTRTLSVNGTDWPTKARARALAQADNDARMQKPTIWFIGPESRVYHTDRDCPLLNNVYRYWPIQSTKVAPAGRRLCKRCEKEAS